MTPEDWKENRDRPAWVQANRDELEEVTDSELPRGRAQLESWTEDNKSMVTKALKDDDGGSE